VPKVPDEAGARGAPAATSAAPSVDSDAAQRAVGFLTVLEHEQHGLVGGYLLLNSAGRPLEFHCTVPVKPNRAQQILFGPTLAPYLYGEQIGQALASKSALVPLVVCTDVEAALALRDYTSLAMALVLAAPDESTTANPTSPWRVDAAHTASPHLSWFSVGRNSMAVAHGRDGDRQTIVAQSDILGEFDLSEPFERIREAIEEAHKGAR
jgi:hypothetical protein